MSHEARIVSIRHTLLRGTRYSVAFSTTAYDLSDTYFTIVARGPESGSSPVTELKWEWRPPGSSDPEFAWDAVNSRLVFTLTSGWTATGFAVGTWRLYCLVDSPATNQDDLTEIALTVRDGRGGAMPVT